MLGRAFRAAVASHGVQRIDEVRIEVNDAVYLVDVTVRPLQRDDAGSDLVLVVFEERPVVEQLVGADAATAPPNQDLVSELNAELETAYTELRAAYDDAQSTREELASLNEELQSTNEELQSINEELTISMEEMQSMNEELQTLNRELQNRVDELTLASDDMANLLDSTQIATLFLDAELRVRRFTPRMGSLVNLLDTDVGRPVTDLTSSVRYPELGADVRAALANDSPVGREVTTDDGRWFAVRVMPYRTHDGGVDGVVMTFTDVTEAKALEARLREDGAS
jgi:two-component system CheB/CheR fusion protein